MIYIALVLQIVFIILFAGFLWFLVDVTFRGHELPTSRRAAREIADVIRARKGEEAAIVDLGCAYGRLPLFFKKFLPKSRVTGVDMSRFRLAFARARRAGRAVSFVRRNMYETNLSGADVVYAYLWYDQLPVLEKKFDRELPPGAVVITNTSFLPFWQPVEVRVVHPDQPDFEKLFVYLKK